MSGMASKCQRETRHAGSPFTSNISAERSVDATAVMKRHPPGFPDQTGRIAIVTGSNSGIGFEAARTLAHSGACVILACRNPRRAQAAVGRISRERPAGSAVAESLDLSRLASIHAFAERIRKQELTLDLLINNAGIMMPPRSRTTDGFELQIGVNHLGHFALTGLLLDSLRNSPGTRIVTVSSLAHQAGRLDFESFRGEKPYRAFREYRQSKLANLMFALELDRRLRRSTYGSSSLAAHPGLTKTELVSHKAGYNAIAWLVGMKAELGALPILFAATDPSARGGEYYGPGGFQETRGRPARARVMPSAEDRPSAARLWAVSEELTGVRYGL